MDNPSYIQTEEDKTNYGAVRSNDANLRLQKKSWRNRDRNLPPISNSKDRKGSQIGLQKTIGFFSCVGILVGGIIGSGIFVSPKGVLLGSGSVGLALVIWIVCGFIALMGSLAYAELGIRMPNSGGQYFYMLNAFDPKRKTEKSFWKSLFPFLYFWQFTFLSKPAAMAVQGMSIANYLMQLSSLGGCSSTIQNGGNSTVFVRLMSAAFILLITFINIYSNKLSTRVINVFTFSKLFALFFIIISGIVKFAHGTNEALILGFEGTTLSFDGLTTAFFSGLWAYSGWDNLNMVTRELINPKRDLLRSLIITCALVTSVYFLTNVAYFTVTSKAAFLSSNAVAVDYAQIIAGKTGAIFMIIAVSSSILGSTIGGNFTSARLSYAAAREGHMVDFFSYVDHKKMTPSVALAYSAISSLIMLPQTSILGLIALTGFLDWIFMFLTMVSLLIVRKTTPRKDGDFKVPIVVPLIVMVFSLFLVVTPFIDKPKMEYFFVLLFLLVGVLVYIVFIFYRFRVPGLDHVRVLVQKVLLVLPCEDDEI